MLSLHLLILLFVDSLEARKIEGISIKITYALSINVKAKEDSWWSDFSQCDASCHLSLVLCIHRILNMGRLGKEDADDQWKKLGVSQIV